MVISVILNEIIWLLIPYARTKHFNLTLFLFLVIVLRTVGGGRILKLDVLFIITGTLDLWFA